MLRFLFSAARPLVIAIWGSGLSFVVATLMISHWVSLPRPTVGETLPSLASTHAASGSATAGTEIASDCSAICTLHVIYTNCPCSRRVLEHLGQRSAIPIANERIVIVSELMDHVPGVKPELLNTLKTLGYSMQTLSPVELFAQHAIESSPLLLITDQSGTVLYSGGYTSHKQGLDYQDTAIVNDVLNGHTPTPLPVLGCAVSKRLQNVVDPLRLKY